MPPSSGSGISVRGDRVGTVDLSDSAYSDEALVQRLEEVLPKLFEKLKCDAGNAECSVNLAGNRLKGPEAIDLLLRRLREAKVQVITLRLHKNQLTDDAMRSVVDHIKAAAAEKRPLLELHLSDNKLTEVGVRKLVEAAHRCKYYFNANSTPERRCRALWLRCENQRPPLENPHGLLESLSADGLGVCLLPSKEFQPPAGRARDAQLEAPVHMHHAFSPRADHPRLGPEAWSGKDRGGCKGGGKVDGGKGDQKGDRGGDWWNGNGSGSGADAKGKDGKDMGQKGKGKMSREQQKGMENGRYPQQDDHRGKGRAIAESWRNAENYASSQRTPGRGDDDWQEWGRDDDWGDPNPSNGTLSGRIETRRFELSSAQVGRAPPLPLSASPLGPGRGDSQPSGLPGRPGAPSPWASPPAVDRLGGRPGSSGGAFGPQGGGYFRGQGQGGLPPFPGGSANGPCSPAGFGVGGGSPWDHNAGVWLTTAVDSVRWKLQVCTKLSMLARSLNPLSVMEHEWHAIASLGSRSIAQACSQRASVVVGSFVEEAAIYHLSVACAGESALAFAFRRLRLASFFAPGSIQDEQNDAQCASCLAAVYGELVDAPVTGESTNKENARKVAEWAMLDFIFLMGLSRLTSAGLMNMGGSVAPGGSPQKWS